MACEQVVQTELMLMKSGPVLLVELVSELRFESRGGVEHGDNGEEVSSLRGDGGDACAPALRWRRWVCKEPRWRRGEETAGAGVQLGPSTAQASDLP